jgi:hypothetical protein
MRWRLISVDDSSLTALNRRICTLKFMSDEGQAFECAYNLRMDMVLLASMGETGKARTIVDFMSEEERARVVAFMIEKSRR